MSYSDEHLDQLLRASGEQWRASEPELDPLSVATLVRQRGHTPSRSFSLPVGAAASLTVVLLVVALVAIYSVGPLGSHTSSSASSTPTASLAANVPGSPTPPVSAPPSPPPTSNPGYEACSAIIDHIPAVIVQSGKPSVAAAYEVTGAQLTRYFIELWGNGGATNGSDWWSNPTKTVDMCVIDGDFEAETPGPSGHDTNASRVLVVIDGSDIFAWAFCFASQTSCGIPLTDPATIAAAPTTSTTPSASASAITVDDWLVECGETNQTDCRGVAQAFIDGTAGWSYTETAEGTGSQLAVELQTKCDLALPSWATGSSCWQASAPWPTSYLWQPKLPGRVCEQMALGDGTDGISGFRQFAGDYLGGAFVSPDWPACS